MSVDTRLHFARREESDAMENIREAIAACLEARAAHGMSVDDFVRLL